MLSQLYEFGPFVLDPNERLLRRNQERLDLPPRVFDVLLALVQNPGRLATREELMERVWPGTAVEENNLTQAIYLIRRVLREGEDATRWVETVPKSGYRFVGTVRVTAAGILNLPNATASEDGRAYIEPRPARGPSLVPATLGWLNGRRVQVVGTLLALSIFGFGALYVGRRADAAGNRQTKRVMLAVLPFANLSGDGADDYLADGLTEEMITQLERANPQRLGVISWTSVMQYKAGGQNVAQIARDLGADYIVEGSIRKQGNGLQVTARLVRARDQAYLWTESYARPVSDVLLDQQEVAMMAARRIQTNLSLVDEIPAAPSRTANSAAYDDFLRAQFYWNRRDMPGLHDAELLYQKAIAEDPAYAPAYAGLANCDLLLSFSSDAPQREEYFTQARAAVLRAIELDESSAEAHTAWAGMLVFHDHDWTRAHAEFERALQLNPNYAQAHHWYANLYLDPIGRYDEAIAQMQLARELDPFNPIINADLGQAYFFARRYEEALAIYKKTAELDPHFQVVQSYLTDYYLALNMRSEAVHEIAALWQWEYVQPNVDAQARSAALLNTYEREGYGAFWQQILAQVHAFPDQKYEGSSLLALILLESGNRRRAIETLERGYQERKPNVIYLRANPLYDGLRSDPRFQALEQEMGLPTS